MTIMSFDTQLLKAFSYNDVNIS